MAKILVLGAGVSGHTAVAYLARKLAKKHEVIMVSPSKYYHWIPSNIWIGVGRMNREDVRFDLNPIYKKWGVKYIQAKATNFYPEGNKDHEKAFVQAE